MSFIPTQNINNTGSGQGLFKGGNVFQSVTFRSIAAGPNVTILSGNNEITISVTGSYLTSSRGLNSGSGQGLYKGNSDQGTLQFRSIVAGTNVTIISGSEQITISAAGASGITSSSGINSGSGQGIYKGNSDAGTLQFRSLIQGSNINFLSGSEQLTISATGFITSSQAVNSGSGEGLYKGNSDLGTLQFRKINAGTNITLVSGSENITINATVPPSISSSAGINLGTGQGLYNGNSDLGTLQFRSLLPGTGIGFVSGSQTLMISYTGSTGINAVHGANVGVGQGTFQSTNAIDTLRFRTLIAGPDIQIISGSEEITIAFTGSKSSGQNKGPQVGQNIYDGNSDQTILQFRRLLPGTGINLISGSDTVMISYTGSTGIASIQGSNVGVGQGIFQSINGTDTLRFRTLIPGSNMAITSGSSEVTISFTGSLGLSSSRGVNSGSGEGIYKGNSDNGTLQFRSIIAGTNITFVSGSESLTISGGGLTSSAGVNSGSGEGIYKGNSDLGTLQFRTLIAGSNISFISGSQSLTIASSGGGATWTEVEIDFGSLPVFDKLFTITDASSTTSSKIIISESGKAATGRVSGDAQWDNIQMAANPGNGSFTVYAKAFPGPVVGKRKIHYTIAI